MKRIQPAILLLALLPNCSLAADAEWSDWIELFNGKDLSGWHLRNPKGKCGAQVQDGILVSKKQVGNERSSYLLSDLEFVDFQLQVEFRVPKGSNAGLYLQGKYEVQIHDSYGKEPFAGMGGSLYRRITPKINVAKPAGEWQTFDITFHAPRYGADGKLAAPGRLTLIHNDVKTIDDAEFVGPTGSSWTDKYEGYAGPIMIQTDHGDVDFRKLRIRGVVAKKGFPKTPPEIIDLTAKAGKGPDGRGRGITLDWRTPLHRPAKKFLVYRGSSADFALDQADKKLEVQWWPPVTDGFFQADQQYYYKVVAVGLDGTESAPSAAVSARGQLNRADKPDLAHCAWLTATAKGGVKRNRSTANKPLTIGGKKFSAGFGVQAPSTIEFLVDQLVAAKPGWHLTGVVGLDDCLDKQHRSEGDCTFVVECDGAQLWKSAVVEHADGAVEFDVALPASAKRLTLRVDSGENDKWDFADWANVRLVQSNQ